MKSKDLDTNCSSDSSSGSPRETVGTSLVAGAKSADKAQVPPALCLDTQCSRGDGPFAGEALTDCENFRVLSNEDLRLLSLVEGTSSSLSPEETKPQPLTVTESLAQIDTEQADQNNNDLNFNSETTGLNELHASNNSSPSHANSNGDYETPFDASTNEDGAEAVSILAPTTSGVHNSNLQIRTPMARRSSFAFFSNLANSIRGASQANTRIPGASSSLGDVFMSNSPTIAILSSMAGPGTTSNLLENHMEEPEQELADAEPHAAETARVEQQAAQDTSPSAAVGSDNLFSVRLTPIIDHSSSNSGLYFSPVIRRLKPNNKIPIGRYTEKNKSAAHAPQGSSQPIVFKSKVVSRTHALLHCKSDGLWFLKDCKSSSGTFLNNVRLSQATMELTYWPVVDGDVIQLGLDYRGGAEDIYRCVKMRCEFNHSWQRKVNQYNLEIHERMKNLRLDVDDADKKRHVTECAICLLTLDPCQALFISPCSHSWHYKCIRPVIIKSYPQFYCPNCRSMCDLETDIEDDA